MVQERLKRYVDRFQTAFSPKQLKVIEQNHKYNPIISISEGAVRSGKTKEKIMLWIEHIYKFRGGRKKFIMSAVSQSSLQRNAIDEIEEFIRPSTPDYRIVLNKQNEFKLFGNTICCFGGAKVSDYKYIKGMTAYGWYANEITEQHKNTVDQCIKRCSGKGARMFWDTNPSYPTHNIKTQYIDNSKDILSDGTMRILSSHYVLEDNIFIDPVFIESLKRSTPKGMWYDRDILGLWVSAEGMIFKDFNPDIHIIDEVPDNIEIKHYFAGVDWGYDHLGILQVWGMDGDGNNYLIEETAEREKGIGWWVKVALAMNEKYGDMIYWCDHRPDNIAEFEDAGITAYPAVKSVFTGVTYVAELYKLRKIFILRGGGEHLVEEIYNYRWGKNDEPIKEEDDSCFVGDTEVLTIEGYKKIRDVKIGDMVATRQGYKRVYNSGCTGIKFVYEYKICSNKITSTNNHKIISNEKIRIADLTQDDICYIIPEKEVAKCKILKLILLYLKELNLEDTQIQEAVRGENTIDQMASILSKEYILYIRKYGKINTGIFLKAIIFIIKTATHLIIRLTTLNVLRKASTFRFIQKNIARIIKRRLKSTWRKLEERQVSGTEVKTGWLGIRSTLKTLTLDVLRLKKYVFNVAKNILGIKTLYTAQTNVRANTGETPRLMIKNMYVNSARRYIKEVNTPNRGSVQEAAHLVITGNYKGKQKVYNISVEGDHEYIANNILVSNCDTMRYAVFSDYLYRKDELPDDFGGYRIESL